MLFRWNSDFGVRLLQNSSKDSLPSWSNLQINLLMKFDNKYNFDVEYEPCERSPTPLSPRYLCHSLFQTSQNNQTGDKTFCILKGLKKGKCHQEKRDKNSLSHVSRHFFLMAKLSVLMLNRFNLSCWLVVPEWFLLSSLQHEAVVVWCSKILSGK